MSDAAPRSPRLLEALLVLIVLTVAVVAFAQSYQRWLHPIIDTGRDLYIAEQISSGAKLYRDIRYQYPPLVPYLLGAITSATGHALFAYMLIGLVVALLTALFLYAIARRTAGVAAAFAVTLLFTATSFTGASTWGANYLFPYSYAATIGMLFVLGFEASLLAGRFGLAIALGGAASWCKIEFAVVVVVSLAVLAALRRIHWRVGAAYGALMLLTFAFAELYFRGTGWLTENVLAASLTHGAVAKRFFASVAGTADWRMTLFDIVLGIGTSALIVLAARRSVAAGAAVAILAGVVLPLPAPFRAWGVLQWCVLLWAIWRDRASPLLPLSLVSVAATLRIPLNVAPVWYGFVLVLPALLLMGYVVFEYLPQRAVYGRDAAVVWVLLFTLLAARSLLDQRRYYAGVVHPVASLRGVFFDRDPHRAATLSEFLAWCGRSNFVVLPEGVTLNYLARAKTPLSFHTLTPVEIAPPAVEDRVVQEFRERRPERVVLVSRSTAEFGFRGLGIDYGNAIASHLREQFVPEKRWASATFQLWVLRRK